MTAATVESYFSASYAQARDAFLDACRESGLAPTTRRHPLVGPDGEALASDAAWIGDRDAARVVVVTSATHGVEGFGGAGIQCGLVRDPGAPRPGSGTALLLIHAVNPYGFAWLHRANEDNVDINRNFVDHDRGRYPDNTLFPLLAGEVIPNRWDEASVARCDARLQALATEHGADNVRLALSRGQYTHADNIYYGGDRPAWSNRTLSELCGTLLGRARRAVLIDLHTGLGPFGYGELMTPSRPGQAVYDRLFRWYGAQLRSTTAGTTQYAGAPGSILAGFTPPVKDLDFAAVGLEFGTRSRPVIDRAIRADVWLHTRGDRDSDVGRRIARELHDAFYPDERDWKQALWERAVEVIAIALDRIAGED